MYIYTHTHTHKHILARERHPTALRVHVCERKRAPHRVRAGDLCMTSEAHRHTHRQGEGGREREREGEREGETEGERERESERARERERKTWIVLPLLAVSTSNFS
jgi:hypothetical protein